MLSHTVFFWLKPELSETERNAFRSELEKLLQIEHIEQGYTGSPAATEKRAAVDHSFDYSLVLFFQNVAAHDAYQRCPEHDAFVSNCSKLWEKVKVYDSELGSE